MRIGLTFNLKPPGATGDAFEEFDSEETIAALESAVRRNGHEPIRLGWGGEMLDRIATTRVDGVFNIAEGAGGRGRESQVPATLEMLGIPCSGASALSIGLTLDKALAKRVALGAGIATARFCVALPVPAALPAAVQHLRFPLFAKPAAEGSSMGITTASLCETREQLEKAVERLSPYGPVLIEEFLPGDEYTVGMIGGEVLGAMQIVPRSRGETFIYSLDVKRDYLQRVDYRLVDEEDVKDVARAVWKAFELRDVARIDVRRDRDGVPNFVEVNPLPGVHPVNSDLIILARLLGVSHDEVIGRVIRSAIARWST